MKQQQKKSKKIKQKQPYGVTKYMTAAVNNARINSSNRETKIKQQLPQKMIKYIKQQYRASNSKGSYSKYTVATAAIENSNYRETEH